MKQHKMGFFLPKRGDRDDLENDALMIQMDFLSGRRYTLVSNKAGKYTTFLRKIQISKARSKGEGH